MSNSDPVLYGVEDGIATITLNRPETLNAMNNPLMSGITACIDRVSPKVEHVEVEATHLGLGFSPEVFEIIAQRLAIEDLESEA